MLPREGNFDTKLFEEDILCKEKLVCTTVKNRSCHLKERFSARSQSTLVILGSKYVAVLMELVTNWQIERIAMKTRLDVKKRCWEMTSIQNLDPKEK